MVDGAAAPQHPAAHQNSGADASEASPTPSPSGATGAALAAELEAIRTKGCGQHGCRHYRRRVRFITPCW
jgi:hypothetical protein